MKEALPYLQNLSALAFLLLGVVTSVGWLRHRASDVGSLALAIVLLSLVTLLGRAPSILHFTPPLLSQLSVLAFMGSGYALLRYRSSIIPLLPAMHTAAVMAILGTSAIYLVSQAAVDSGRAPASSQTLPVLALVVVWSAAVCEPIIRFWLVAKELPPVQAWRLRALSLGFAGLVVIIVLAVGAGASNANTALQIGIQLLAIAIVPLLYVSFSPPAWLRREWRASEEEGLRVFMQELLLLHEDLESLSHRALDWAMRLTGGAAAVAFRVDGSTEAVVNLAPEQLALLAQRLANMKDGVSRLSIRGVDRTIIVFPRASLVEAGRLVIVSGPFSPGFGPDELSRVQQFFAAVSAALDRARLMQRLNDANHQLEEADKHKSTFLANMSHELRTPLNAILGFSELLLDAQEGQFPPATKNRFLEQIHSSGKHLLGLINDVLDLSKVEAGQMELRKQPVSIAAAIEQVLSTVEPLASAKKIRLEAEATDAGEILADPGKLKQMLLNLVSNAIKFTPTEGSVTVQVRQIADAIELLVTDTGVGIAEKDKGRIFEAFHQVDTGPGQHQPGTGLGLTLTRRFAHLHGGEIRVESEVGRGSTFILTLPVNGQLAHPIPAPAPAVAQSNGRTDAPLILVVEDDPAAAELICRILERGGYRTTLARSGKAAIAKARELKPAAITLDIILPELDGWDVLTNLKQDEVTRHIPVVVVSIVDNAELGIALGALDYFVKPVDPESLLRSLKRFKLVRPEGAATFRVLVVDDEQSNRDFLVHLLEPAGYTVAEATGGRQAITMAKAWRPHLMLLDLMMPEVTGFDVVEALRADESTAQLPILVLTAKDLTEADKRQLSGHVSTILSRRSTKSSELLTMLSEVLTRPLVNA
jgi:signal transduction histidine kinase/DNA-binding response OmpR family regulator